MGGRDACASVGATGKVTGWLKGVVAGGILRLVCWAFESARGFTPREDVFHTNHPPSRRRGPMAIPDSLTRQLVRFALDTRFEDLPPGVVDTCKSMMVNAAAVGLAAAGRQESLDVTRYVQDMSPRNGRCTIIGMGLRTSPVNAALANGTMIHLLDFDDQVLGQDTHPSSVIFPVVMALAEMNGHRGKDVLTAFAVGCEVVGKAASLIEKTPAASQGWRWHGDGIAGALGAAAAAGRLLGLDEDGLEQALGIACGGAGGIGGDAASPSRALQCGRAAANGLSAVLLVQKGFPGPKQVVEAPGGLLATYGSGDLSEYSSAISSLGDPYQVVKPGIVLKPYPCHLAGHTAIDAVHQLAQQFQFGPDEVRSAKVEASQAVLDALPFSSPSSGGEARLSLNYIVAAALLYGQPLIDQFTSEAVQSLEARAMMDRVTVEAIRKDDTLSPSAIPVTVELTSSRVLRHQVEYSRGRPELPLEPEELDAKFLYCCRYILPPDHIDGALTQFRGLEEVEDVTGLASILGG